MYANNIKRLAGYIGRGLDQTVKLAFVMSFSDSVSMTLQQSTSMNKIKITDLILTARVLKRTRSLDSGTVEAVTHSKKPTDRCQGAH